MKKIILAAIAAVMSAGAFALSLAEASAKITDIANDPGKMSAVIKELSKDDQVAFLGRVNKAIADTKRTPDAKAEAFLAVNKAALLANKGNLKALIAEVYATVPPAALTVINERFAEDLFKRDVNPAKPVSDADMKKHAVDTMKVIQARNVGNDNASVRDTFAILMFLRASKGTPADLKDTLVAGLTDPEARQLAKESWIPSAMGDGTAKTYDPMLGVSEVDPSEAPSPATNFVNLQGPAVLTGALIADLSPTVDKDGKPTVTYSDMYLDPNKYALPSEGVGGLNRVPRSLDKNDKWHPSNFRGSSSGDDDYTGGGESGGYRMQTTR